MKISQAALLGLAVLQSVQCAGTLVLGGNQAARAVEGLQAKGAMALRGGGDPAGPGSGARDLEAGKHHAQQVYGGGGGSMAHHAVELHRGMVRQESVVSEEGGHATIVGKNTPTCGFRNANSVWGVPQGDVNRAVESNKGLIDIVTSNIIGNGTFGVVYEGRLPNNERVAVKKVLQDTRFRNRELSIMRALRHPNVVRLNNFFFTSQGTSEDIYLNLVMEYVPDSLHRIVRHHFKRKEVMPRVAFKLYMWQLLRSLAYLHRLRICHRDIKPQNVLVDPEMGIAKLCDLGSAKRLSPGFTSISYICSRFYRAPELILGATEYTTAVDMWSFGCVMGECMLGRPIFPGESSTAQLTTIGRVLGLPDAEALREMRVAFTVNDTGKVFSRGFRFDGWGWLRTSMDPPEHAMELLQEVLNHNPKERKTAIECLMHPFFDEIKDPECKLPNGQPAPNVFSFTNEEVSWMQELNIVEKVVPAQHMADLVLSPNVTPSPVHSRATSPGLGPQANPPL